MLFPQPETKTVDEPWSESDQPCPNCSEPPCSATGWSTTAEWLAMTKCRSCLTVIEGHRILAPAQGG